mmetsp:Transcript_2045/g.5915  ORF Transcript_2045/g.5915 Transcript_2045/m.5915 type:complete len:215 (-) Transcript_2045:1000-1644(-)
MPMNNQDSAAGRAPLAAHRWRREHQPLRAKRFQSRSRIQPCPPAASQSLPLRTNFHLDLLLHPLLLLPRRRLRVATPQRLSRPHPLSLLPRCRLRAATPQRLSQMPQGPRCCGCWWPPRRKRSSRRYPQRREGGERWQATCFSSRRSRRRIPGDPQDAFARPRRPGRGHGRAPRKQHCPKNHATSHGTCSQPPRMGRGSALAPAAPRTKCGRRR